MPSFAKKQFMETVDEYIMAFPVEVQYLLKHLRKIIMECAPEATESLAYQMPSYKTNGRPLVYFAAFQNHIGFYATPSGHTEFKEELSKYKQGKGSVQFPLNKPIPFDLIRQIVAFRVEENKAKSKKKSG
jgi:uncharacterized protein YdhG (YjbR/CyaY superfamily)